MEYLAGGSLRDIIGAHPLDIDAALWIAYHLAQSLAYIHHQGCVHRDIKPENILFRSLPADGGTNGNKQLGQLRPVLVDFGVAAARGEPKLVSGSRLWMAPELQAAYEQSPLPVDPAWDVYALGLILCYMITGRRPRRRSYEYASVLAYRDHTLAVLEQELKKREKRRQHANSRSRQDGAGQKHGDSSTINVRLQQLITAMLAQRAGEAAGSPRRGCDNRYVTGKPQRTAVIDARLRCSWTQPHLSQRKRIQLVLVAALLVGRATGGAGAVC